MAIMGALHSVHMETLMVSSLLLDSQVLQSYTFAYLESFRSYHCRDSIRSFES